MLRDWLGRLFKVDARDRKIPKKQLKRRVLQENVRRGKAAEDTHVTFASALGDDVKRTGRGSDFKHRGIANYLTGKKKTTLVEVKTPKAKLSKLQRKTKKKHGSNYVVKRYDL